MFSLTFDASDFLLPLHTCTICSLIQFASEWPQKVPTNMLHTPNFYIANSCPSTILLSLLPLGLLTWYIPSRNLFFSRCSSRAKGSGS